jgi:hypothetical protein
MTVDLAGMTMTVAEREDTVIVKKDLRGGAEAGLGTTKEGTDIEVVRSSTVINRVKT